MLNKRHIVYQIKSNSTVSTMSTALYRSVSSCGYVTLLWDSRPLERQESRRRQDAPLAVGARAHVGGCVDCTYGVTGADQEIRQPLGDAGGCVAFPLLYVVAAQNREFSFQPRTQKSKKWVGNKPRHWPVVQISSVLLIRAWAQVPLAWSSRDAVKQNEQDVDQGRHSQVRHIEGRLLWAVSANSLLGLKQSTVCPSVSHTSANSYRLPSS